MLKCLICLRFPLSISTIKLQFNALWLSGVISSIHHICKLIYLFSANLKHDNYQSKAQLRKGLNP